MRFSEDSADDNMTAWQRFVISCGMLFRTLIFVAIVIAIFFIPGGMILGPLVAVALALMLLCGIHDEFVFYPTGSQYGDFWYAWGIRGFWVIGIAFVIVYALIDKNERQQRASQPASAIEQSADQPKGGAPGPRTYNPNRTYTPKI